MLGSIFSHLTRVNILAGSAAIACLIAAGSFLYFTREIVPSDPGERIFIDSPEVYTRERLINERLAEEAWLLKELEKVDLSDPKISAIRTDSGSIRVWIGEKEKISPNKADAATNSYKRQQAQSTSGGTAQPPLSDSVGQSTNPAIPGATTTPPTENTTPPANAAMPNPDPAVNQAPLSPASEEQQLTSPVHKTEDVGVTFDQSFKLRSAYRSLIRQRLIENKLDDRHDLSGNSLYILKFDTTVFSVPALGHQAQTQVNILGPSSLPDFRKPGPDDRAAALDDETAYFEEIYSQWIANLQTRINRAVKLEIERLKAGEIPWSRLDQIHRMSHLPGVDLNDGSELSHCLNDPKYESCLPPILAENAEVFDALANGLVLSAIADTIGVARNDIQATQVTRQVPSQRGGNARLTKATYSLEVGQDPGRIIQLSVQNFVGIGDVPQIIIDRYVVYFSSQSATCKVDNFEGWPVGSSTDKYKTFIYEGAEGGLQDTIALFKSEIEPVLGQIQGTKRSRFWSAANYAEIYKASTAKPSCPEEIRGVLEMGLDRFMRRVSQYASYSYSVLPKENPIAIKGEIKREIGVAGNTKWFGYDLGQDDQMKSVALQPLLSTYGEIDVNDDPSRSPTPVVGWSISPSVVFGTETSSLTSISESVLAIVSVPAWWPDIQLRVDTNWLDRHGRPVLNADTQSRTYRVELPRNQELLDALVFDQNRRGPVVTQVVKGTNTTGCGARSVILIGQRLWRNTAVTLGGVRASNISVMPDMSAVMASFNNNPDQSIGGKLIVWTSEGFDEVKTDSSLVIPAVIGPC
jgi:hypothetical protein